VIRKFLTQIKGRLEPGWSVYKPWAYDSGVSKDMWQQISGKLDDVMSQVDLLDSERDEVLPMYGSQVGASATKAKALVDKLSSLQEKIKLSEKIKDQAVKDKYTQQIIDEIKEINANVNNIDVLNVLEKEVDGFIAKVSVNV
jgi:hypothetical protein